MWIALGGGILLASTATASATAARQEHAFAAVELKILAGFLASLSLLLLAGGYTYRADERFADSLEGIARTQELRASLASLYGSLAGAEIALRDHLLTGGARQLADYQGRAAEVQRELAILRHLTAEDPAQRRNLAALEPVVAARLSAMQAEVRAYEEFGLPAARALITLTRNQNTAGDVRELTDRMALLDARAPAPWPHGAAAGRDRALLPLLATLAIAVGFFTVLFRAIHRQMRARREAEAALRAGNRFLDSLIENLPVMVAIKDARDLRFVRVNRAVERLLGASREAFVGRTAHELFAAEEADFVVAKDREALEHGRLVDIPEQRIHTDRLGTRVFHTMKMPLGSGLGRADYLLAIAVDITERKLAEQAIHELNSALAAKADQLTATNRELESFSYSVSHDLRAPLRAIDGFAQMLEEDCARQLGAEGRRYLSVIRENSRRMGALIDDLLAFSRLGRLAVVAEEIDVESLVHDVVHQALEGRAPPAPRIEIGALPPARGDPVLLRQVWVNLIANAIKYSSKAPRPHIEVRGERGEFEDRYSIRDNGVGFDMQYAAKLFGVFQRLHRSDEFSGTGVGLAIVHRVVTRHGGRVWAEGRVNGGAVFGFALPRRGHDG